MLGYLGAYTHRIAISNARILRIGHGRVAFRVRDSADANRQKAMQRGEHEFIRHFLLHALPKGFVRIRHDGLLGLACQSTSKREDRALSRPARGAQARETPDANSTGKTSRTHGSRHRTLSSMPRRPYGNRRSDRPVLSVQPAHSPRRGQRLVMIVHAKRPRPQPSIWDATFAPQRHSCAKMPGSASDPSSCRRLTRRLQSRNPSNMPTARTPAAVPAATGRHASDRIPKDDPPSQPAWFNEFYAHRGRSRSCRAIRFCPRYP